MDGLNANTTFLGAITLGMYAFIAKFIWETVMRVWKTKKNGSPPPEPGTDPVVAADVKATREVAERIKSDTSTLKDRDTERATALKGIGESNVRQETMMEAQNGHLVDLVKLGQDQLTETKRVNGRG